MAANRNDASIEPAHCTSGQLLTLPLALTSHTLLGTSPAKTSHVSMDLEAKRWDICWSFLELFFANLQSRDVAFSDMAMAADGDGGCITRALEGRSLQGARRAAKKLDLVTRFDTLLAEASARCIPSRMAAVTPLAPMGVRCSGARTMSSRSLSQRVSTAGARTSASRASISVRAMATDSIREQAGRRGTCDRRPA